MAAAVVPRLKTLSLEIYNYEDTTPELSLVYHMQSLKAEEIKKFAFLQWREEDRKENFPSHTEVQNSAVT